MSLCVAADPNWSAIRAKLKLINSFMPLIRTEESCYACGQHRSVWMFGGHGHSTAERGQELLPPPQKQQHSMDPLPSSRAEGWRERCPRCPPCPRCPHALLMAQRRRAPFKLTPHYHEINGLFTTFCAPWSAAMGKKLLNTVPFLKCHSNLLLV